MTPCNPIGITSSNTLTVTAPPTEAPRILQIILRAAPDTPPQKEYKAKIISYMKAAAHLVEIQRWLKNEINNWQDPLSLALLDWISEFNEFALKAIRLRRGDDGVVAEALNDLDRRIDTLFHKVLGDPMEHPKVLDNPLIEGGLHIWGENLLRRYRNCTPISPYTQQPLDAKPHLLARAILDWGKEYFPAYFEPLVVAEEPADKPLEKKELKAIQKNAKILVQLHKGRTFKLKVLQAQQKAEETARQTHQSNFQMLLQRTTDVRNALQEESDVRCHRLNETITQLKEFFEAAIAGERAERALLQSRHDGILSSLVRLQVHAAGLERRTQALESEIVMLRQSVACAYQSMNDDGGDCAIM